MSDNDNTEHSPFVLPASNRVSDDAEDSNPPGRIRRRRAVLSRRPVLIDFDVQQPDHSTTPASPVEQQNAASESAGEDASIAAVEAALRQELEVDEKTSVPSNKPNGPVDERLVASLDETLSGLSKAAVIDPSATYVDVDRRAAEMAPAAATAPAVEQPTEPVDDDEVEAIGSVFSAGVDVGSLDEEALRDLVSEIVRQELQGELGERITRNVRKLVRREIQNALASRGLT